MHEEEDLLESSETVDDELDEDDLTDFPGSEMEEDEEI